MTIQELYTRWAALRVEFNTLPACKCDTPEHDAMFAEICRIEDQAVAIQPKTVEEISLQLCIAGVDEDLRQVNTLMGAILDRARGCVQNYPLVSL